MLESTKLPQKNSTRVSPASPGSSPLTPELGIQPHQEPALAGYPHQSATLDAIGAWSSVQPADPSTVYPDSATQHHNPTEGNIHGGVPLPPTNLQILGSKYNAMSLSGGGSSSSHIDIQHDNNTTSNGPISANSSSAINDTDYSELDEAILRGRSTTLPNIMAIPNSLYRFSGAAVATDGNAAGSNENAGYGGILSSRSNDNINNENDRAGSPLSLSLKTNPIHQSASLGNQLTSSLDPFQFTSSISPSARNSNAPPPSASSRRFSEFGVGNSSNEYSSNSTSYLSLASYSMVAAAPPPPPANRTKATAVTVAATVNGNSGVSHANSGRAGFAPNAIGSHAASFLHSGHPQPHPVATAAAATLETATVAAAPLKYASFSQQQQQILPTMREDDNGSTSNSLTRHLSLTRYTNTTAIPQPLSSSSTSNLYGFRAHTVASPTSPIRESNPTASSSSYLPTRVHSLKDIRLPSPGPNTSESLLHITSTEEQMVNSLFERAAHTQSFDPQPPPGGVIGMHRRHSLASTSLITAGSLGGILGKHQATNANINVNARTKLKTPGPAEPANSSNSNHIAGEEPQKDTAAQAHEDEHQFSIHPVPLQRQYSTPAMLPFGGQLAIYPSRPPAIGTFIPGDGISGSQQQHYAFATAAYPGIYGTGAGQQYAAHNLAFVPGMQPPPMMAPPHLQPPPGNMQGQPPPGLVHSPMPFAIQVQPPVQTSPPPPPPPPPPSSSVSTQQQQEKQQHARRASHPALPATSVSMRPQNLAAVVSNNNSAGIAASSSGAHPPILPNPATTINPNMPFADMGKGLAYKSLSQGTRVFVVQFKGRRSDLFFAPKKGMESRVIPTMAPTSSVISIPKTTKDKEESTKPAVYEPGTFVLVEGDRGVDLGEIKEELTTAESIQAFSNSQSFDASNGSDHHHHDTRHNSAAGLSSMHASGDESSTAGREVFVKRIFRPAYQSEIIDLTGNKASDEQKALSMCQGKVQQRKLCMKVVDAEFQFDRRKLTFYFTADRRVDFRELVRELFKHFKTRIWMCQQTTTSH